MTWRGPEGLVELHTGDCREVMAGMEPESARFEGHTLLVRFGGSDERKESKKKKKPRRRASS